MKLRTEDIQLLARKALEHAHIGLHDHGGQAYSVLTSEIDAARTARSITDLASRILRTRSPLFGRDTQKGSGLVSTPLGTQVRAAINHDFASIRQVFTEHLLHPNFVLFEKHIKRGIPGCCAPLAMYASLLNQRIDAMRAEAKTRAFQKKLARFVGYVRKNMTDMLRYIDALMHENQALVVVRLDLGYPYAEWPPHEAPRKQVSYREAKRHRETLLQHLQNQFPVPLKGYAWKVLHSLQRSYHYQLLLFFDAQATDKIDDVALGKSVGLLWHKDITQGVGTYHNHNASPKKPRGLGRIRSIDLDALTSLRTEVAPQLVMSDYYLRPAMGGGHTFDKGDPPKVAARTWGSPPVRFTKPWNPPRIEGAEI